MLGPEETLALTGHPVGGVCPFGLATPLPVYLDRSLQDFDEVLPAAGSLNSSVRVTPARLAEIFGDRWVDICTLPTATDGAERPAGQDPTKDLCQRDRAGRFSMMSPAVQAILFSSISRVTSLSGQRM
jgi:hypothetical protein